MIQVINRALDLLELISIDPDRPKSLRDLAESLDLNHGTCANILKTLIMRGYVEQVSARKGYVLGPKSYAITGNEAYYKDLLEASKEEMDRLTEVINENCLLAILKDNQRIAVYRTYAEQDLQVRTADVKNAYESASGRLLVAMLPREKVQRYVGKYGLPLAEVWPEVSSEREFMDMLDLIRSEELAIQVVPSRHVLGLAVPVRKHGVTVASLSVYLPEYRYMNLDKQKLLKSIRQSADRITGNIK